jgi:glutathione S-transferase
VSTLFIGTWLGHRVGGFRKAAKIPYPYEYASYEQIQTASPASSKAMITFNAAQRAHQNYVENIATAVGSMLIAGLTWPTATAALGAAWSVGRIAYGIGYTRSAERGGGGRYYGLFGTLAHYVLMVMAGISAWQFAAKV